MIIDIYFCTSCERKSNIVGDRPRLCPECNKPTLEREFKSVHDRHCCPEDGCKYGDENCPVEKGIESGIPCEFCMYGPEGVFANG